MDIKTLFYKIKDSILVYIPKAHIEHVGGTSIPGALTKGDLDISVSVEEKDFKQAVEFCSKLFQPVYQDMLWNNNFAVFQDKSNPIKVDIMLVVRNSSYDSFVKTRDFISRNSEVLNEYNKIKEQYLEIPYEEYLKMKKGFFENIRKEKLFIIS